METYVEYPMILTISLNKFYAELRSLKNLDRFSSRIKNEEET